MKKLSSPKKSFSLKVEHVISGKTETHVVKFVDEGYTFLFNAQHIFLKLNNLQRCFFDYLCERMNIDNTVYIDGALKNDFIQFLEKITGGKKTLNERSVSNYVKALVDAKLLIESKRFKMLYIVNPKYVFKGTKENRKKILKTLLKNPNKYDIDNTVLLNIPMPKTSI